MKDEDLIAIAISDAVDLIQDARYVDFQQRLAYFFAELQKPKTTRMILWEEYNEQKPDGYKYSQFCEILSRFIKGTKSVMHFEHTAGEELQFDFAGDKLSYVDLENGEMIKCPVLVCVLPFSCFTYVEALHSERREDLINGLNHCLQYIGGVPQSIKSDNLAQWVKKANRYEPSFTDFADQISLHYGTTMTATRVKKPRDKATVESSVNTAYNRIYASIRNKTAQSLRQLNEFIFEELQNLNHKKMQQHDYSRYERFLQYEKPLLKPIPAVLFVIKHTVNAAVQRNYHVMLGEDKHYYSVPCQYIGQTLKIIYDRDNVEIFLSDYQRIVTHVRSYKRYGYTTIPEHMPKNHSYYAKIKGYDEKYFLEKAGSIGLVTTQAIQSILKNKLFEQQCYTSCLGVLRLGEKYGNDRLELACKRAVEGPKVTYMIIKSILDKKLDQVPLQTDLFYNVPEHENIRGSQNYQ
jgi:transposase